MSKIDIIIPVHRGEFEKWDKVKLRLDLIERIGDTDGVTYTILGTYSNPPITEEELRALVPSSFFKVKVIGNEEFENIAKEYDIKLIHYYQITTIIWEWIVRHHEELKTGEIFYLFHPLDKIPFSLDWANNLHSSWVKFDRPFLCGELWHGCNSVGPFCGDTFPWSWSEHPRSWWGWGAYDGELPHIAWKKKLPVFQTTADGRLWYFQYIWCDPSVFERFSKGDFGWIKDRACSSASVIHEKSDALFDAVNAFLSKKIEERNKAPLPPPRA